MEASGSGFLISKDGYIMTNNHVVEDAQRIKVMLQDRREFDARVVGRDPTTDVAVIKIEGTGFPAVRLGDPTSTRVGEWVLAIGNPLGLDFTVTAGHRQRQGPAAADHPRDAGRRAGAASTPSRASSRPTRRSTRATRAGRW